MWGFIMQVQSVNNYNLLFGSGLYFVADKVSFDKGIELANKAGVKVSQEGYKYIEKTNLSAPVIKRFKNNKFINSLAEKFDTFVLYEEIPQNKKYSSNHIVMAKVWWFDTIKNLQQYKGARGVSRTSKEKALERLFKEL